MKVYNEWPCLVGVAMGALAYLYLPYQIIMNLAEIGQLVLIVYILIRIQSLEERVKRWRR